MKKTDTFKFRTNLAEKITFVTDVKKEGDSQYGHWKLYDVSVNKIGYSLFPSDGLQARLDQIGNLKGRTLEIGKYEEIKDGKTRTYWQICDEQGAEIDFDPSKYQLAAKASLNAKSEAYGDLVTRLDKAAVAFKAIDSKVKELEVRLSVLEAKELPAEYKDEH